MLNLIYFLYPIGLEFRLSQQEFNIFNILYIDWSFTHFDYFAFLLESIKITNNNKNNNNKKEFVSIFFIFYFIFYFVSFYIFVVVILLNKIQSETKISHLFLLINRRLLNIYQHRHRLIIPPIVCLQIQCKARQAAQWLLRPRPRLSRPILFYRPAQLVYRKPYSCAPLKSISALQSALGVAITALFPLSKAINASASGRIVSVPSVLLLPNDNGSWLHRQSI